ncbi:MAG: helix-turn-helix domain-containing protein [Firmicutes bacterium]|nr:helix-turn-helix domain-containing protein [Bacillota bacterium]
MSSFPERLTELLKATKTTKRALAQTIGVSERMIQYYVRGVKSPTMEILIAIADHFSVSIDFLVGRTDDPTPPKKG